MATLTIRHVPEDVHRALRVQAARHGRSAEAEVRHLLAQAVLPDARLRLGDALSALGRDLGLSNEDVDVLTPSRHAPAAEPMGIE